MRNWKRGAALLAALGLSLGLLGCGDSTPSEAQQPPPPMKYEEAENTEPEYVEPEALPPEDISSEEQETLEPPKGLIFVDRDKNTTTAGQLMCTIRGLNPETGEDRVISRFAYQDTRNVDGCSFSEWMFPLYCRRNFSSDYSKMILTKVFVNRGSGQESHAGWIDTNGNFYDVTEALGLLTNDGSESGIPMYQSLWFWDDRFEYLEIENGADMYDCFVPMDNMTQDTIQKMDFHSTSYPYPYNKYDVTSWIDSTHCIVNGVNNGVIQSLILDTESRTTSNYVPDGFQESWNGIISPDGTQIAFMARSDGSEGNTDIYLMPVSGGEPLKLSNHAFSLQNARYLNGSWGGTCTLIDWI